MKFFDKLNFRRFAKVAAVATVSGILFFGGTADAATNQDEGMAAFREAYFGQMAATRVVDQDLTLISPNFHLDMDSKAQLGTDGVMRMSGNLAWTYTNLKRNYSTNSNIPFYIEQSGNEMTLYVQRRGRWSKMLLPGLPTGIVALWISS